MLHQGTKLLSRATVLVLFTVWAAAILAKTTEEIVHVPTGKPAMVDGKIGPEEWSDAAEAEMPGGGRLYIKTSGDFVYMAVQFPAGRSGFTDIYIAPEDGAVHDLHASAKLGERQFEGGKWPEWSDWWNNRGWVANVSQVESFEKRTFVPEVALDGRHIDGVSGREIHCGKVSGTGERFESREVAESPVRPLRVLSEAVVSSNDRLWSMRRNVS